MWLTVETKEMPEFILLICIYLRFLAIDSKVYLIYYQLLLDLEDTP